MMSAEHSPLPWHVEMRGPGNVVEWIATPPDSSGFTEDVALIVSHNEKRSAADAAIIVRAVNNHEALVGALRAALNSLDGEVNDGTVDCMIDRVLAAQRARDLLKQIDQPHSR